MLKKLRMLGVIFQVPLIPRQTEFLFEGPHALSVDVGALVTGATQTELSSQRLAQLSHSYIGKLL
jgi:hypothetical protein